MTLNLVKQINLIAVETGINLQGCHGLTILSKSYVSCHLACLKRDPLAVVRIGENVKDFLLRLIKNEEYKKSNQCLMTFIIVDFSKNLLAY